MTTNAGASEMDSGSIGIHVKANKNEHKRDKVIKNFFSPEFRNRLSSIIHFNRLEEKQIVQIVEKFINQISVKLMTKSIELEVPYEVLIWFAKVGFDPKMGARPLERLIQEKLVKPISREILFGKYEKAGGTVSLKVEKEELKLLFE